MHARVDLFPSKPEVLFSRLKSGYFEKPNPEKLCEPLNKKLSIFSDELHRFVCLAVPPLT